MSGPSLSDQLGYTYPAAGAGRRSIIRLMATKPMAALNSRVAHRLDRMMLVATGGRATVTSLLTGLPVIFVTTTGARSGTSRTVPLLGIPVGPTMALIGTGFGQRPTPGWVHNLRANPAAQVKYRDRGLDVVARIVEGAEADAIWAAAASLYPGYVQYPKWASHRQISVFSLEATA